MFSCPDQGELFGESGGTSVGRSCKDVSLVKNYLLSDVADQLMASLSAPGEWRQDQIRIYGKLHPLPRLHRWFADSGQTYRWSGIEMKPEPFPPLLDDLRRRLASERGVVFNTALGNLYRDGKDSVSWHADDEPDLGPEPVIASLSLGATRRFSLRRKDNHADVISYELTHGSLLWMSGSTQTVWEHAVPKTSRIVGARINVTFRAIRGR